MRLGIGRRYEKRASAAGFSRTRKHDIMNMSLRWTFINRVLEYNSYSNRPRKSLLSDMTRHAPGGFCFRGRYDSNATYAEG